MPHDHAHHGHHHGQGHADKGDRKLAAAVAVNLALTVAQIVGGAVSGSLALVADAIHNLSDALALLIALVARRIARRGGDAGMTFGYGRAETVAALINFTTLIAISLYLAAEAVMRLLDPPGVEGWIVVAVAGFALVVDVATAALTYAMSKDSLNIRAAFLHNVADALSSVAVIVGGTLILLYDWRLVDPLVTLLIAGYILWHAAHDIRPVIRILMLASPEAVRREDVAATLAADPAVTGVHHVHLWQIDERRVSLEAHIVVDPAAFPEAPALLARLKAALLARHGIAHSTLQLETEAGGCGEPMAPGGRHR